MTSKLETENILQYKDRELGVLTLNFYTKIIFQETKPEQFRDKLS